MQAGEEGAHPPVLQHVTSTVANTAAVACFSRETRHGAAATPESEDWLRASLVSLLPSSSFILMLTVLYSGVVNMP